MTCNHHENDKTAREVIREALDQTLFVEAGAGTGKTSALVDRVVALVLNGTEVDRIAAVTFTEKAAAELRDRVRSALENAQAKSGAAPRIAAALESLDRAQISTIHSFAQTLLRAFSAQASVDPDFEVQDEVSAQRRMQERWRLHLEGLDGNRAAEEAIDRVLSLGLQTGDIEGLATDLVCRPELAELLQANPLTAEEPSWPDVAEIRSDVQSALNAAPPPDSDHLARRLDGLLTVLQAIERARPDEREATLAAGAEAIGSTYKGSDSKWGGRDDRKAALEVAEDVSGRLNELLAGLRAAALSELMPFVVDFVRKEEVARAREGALTYDDLIVRVRDVLRDDAHARTAFRERFAALLIDEFQDTDPLQMEIALAFARERDDTPLEPGRLFLVGDPKQSIYRFRRADMAMYSRTRSEIEAGGSGFPELALNRRSRPEILDWVNAVFAPLIGDGDRPGIQPPYREVHHDRQTALAGPGVAWMGGPVDQLARGMRNEEARAIAAQCRRAVSEPWHVQERDGTVRDASYGDIAVLIPRRILLTALERALADAGAPYRVEGGSLIYRTQEVRDIINCLTAIDDPADEVAIAGALRSPAFACSDADLAGFVTDGGRINYLRRDLNDRSGPVANGLRTLREYHEGRHETSLAGLVEKVVWERHIVEVGTIDQADRNAFRRARFMIEQARSFERGQPESLRAFVAWLERQSERMIVDHEGASIDDDEDAVRIMTIHGAKGLEFPIVILGGLSATINRNDYPTYLADYAAGRAGVHTGRRGGNRSFELGDYTSLRQTELDHALAEMDRLLYVASTRARDHLVVSLYHTSRQRESWAQRLIGHGAREHAEELAAPGSTPATGGPPLAGLAVELPDGLDPARFRDERSALVEAATTRRFTSATALKRERDEEAERTDASEPWSRGRAGTRLGRAVHATIQSLPLDPDDATIAAFARAQAVAEAIPAKSADAARLVSWVVHESEAWQRARTAPRALREAPFVFRHDGAVVEGFIDLLIETPEGIELVDWKTDQIEASEVEDRLRRYALQAGLYVHGVQAATGRTVTRVTYVFAHAKVEASPGEAGALAEAAVAELSAI